MRLAHVGLRSGGGLSEWIGIPGKVRVQTFLATNAQIPTATTDPGEIV